MRYPLNNPSPGGPTAQPETAKSCSIGICPVRLTCPEPSLSPDGAAADVGAGFAASGAAVAIVPPAAGVAGAEPSVAVVVVVVLSAADAWWLEEQPVIEKSRS